MNFQSVLLTSLLMMSAFCLSVDNAAGCANNGATITNSSKYTVQVSINGQAYIILSPGQSTTDPRLVTDGANKVSVKPITKKGEIDKKILGPKPSTITGDCSGNTTSTLEYKNSHFVKHGGSSGGHGSSTPKPNKPVGNKKGQKLNLSGDWLSYDDGETGRCGLFLIDYGASISGQISCSGSVQYTLEGQRVGGRLQFIALSSGDANLFLGSFEIFAKIETDEGKLDALKGFLLRPIDESSDAQKFTFLRISDPE